MGFTQLEDTVTLLHQVFVPVLCVWLTPLVCSSLCIDGNFARRSSQCYREFKNKKGGSLNASCHSHFPFLNPFPLLISIIRTRTLSNLSAKTKDIHFCTITTHVACILALSPFLVVFYCIYLHKVLQSKVQRVFPPKKKITGSPRVLATAMDGGQESLLALATSTSLRPWVQQGLGVMLVTDACAHLHSGKTMVYHSSDVLFHSIGSIMDSCVTSSSERYSLKPDKAQGQNIPSALSVSLSFVQASSDKLMSALPLQQLTSIHAKQNLHTPSTPNGNFARCSSQ
jgi:hypothetical protein